MSTILKALRRLEEQKSNSAARPLRDEVVLSPRRRAARAGLLRAAVAGAAVAIAGVTLVFAFRPAPEAATPEVVAAPVPPAPPAVSAPPPEARITVAAPEQPAPNPVVPVPSASPEFEIVRPDPKAASRPLSPLPLPTIQDEAVAGEDSAPVAPRVTRHPDPEEYVEEPLEEAPAPRHVARETAPVRVARTLWHPSPERRLAWVEVEGQTALREVREGERVGPYVVREIEPTAVLFADGDVEMRREVGP